MSERMPQISFLSQLFEGAQLRLELDGPIFQKTNEYPSSGHCRVVDTQSRKPQILPGNTVVFPAQ